MTAMSHADAPWDAVLGVGDVVHAARAEMLRSGGGAQFTERELACVQARFGSAWTAECYVEDPHKIAGYTFACALLVNLVMAHCLTDGNKRLAWISFTMALARIGLDLDASTEEAERFCLQVITSGLDHGAVARWVSGRAIALDAG